MSLNVPHLGFNSIKKRSSSVDKGDYMQRNSGPNTVRLKFVSKKHKLDDPSMSNMLQSSQKISISKIVQDAAKDITQNTWQELSPEEIYLRKFDMDMNYGPCSDLTRFERWNAAKKAGKKPPEEVLELIRAAEINGKREMSVSLWHDISQRLLEEENRL